MAAPLQVSTQEIVNALLTWRGVVADVARAVGLSRNGLYERMKRLNLDPEKFRNASRTNPAIPITAVSMVPSMTSKALPSNAAGVLKNSGAIFHSSETRRRLAGMEQATAAAAGDEAVPIKTAPRRQEPIRIKPEQRDLLQRAVWDLQSRFQATTDQSLILEQFIEEEFLGWIARKVQKNGKAEKRKGGA